ncbi:MAG: hypothetical protein IPK17_19110 [Chloroflexi bacterium]|uniref:protein kinase domain-containing protein n=1 Tax=Candidatus Flexifilum breve TaxID=3140694 RepID=UPI0031372FC7|nr:hypothetical protein [Chloroflexota bacterium]
MNFRTLASLRHPNIISVIDCGFRRAALAAYNGSAARRAHADLCGSAPRRRSRRGLLGGNAARPRLPGCIGAASFYGDLKPGNVLVEPSGRVKVLDFGLALEKNMPNDDTTGMTGTLAYLAPELLTDSSPSILRPVFGRSDGVRDVRRSVPYNMENAAQPINDLQPHPG